MKYLLLSLVLLLFLAAGCLPVSERAPSPSPAAGDLSSLATPSIDRRGEELASGDGIQNNYSCLVRSYGEVWQKSYEVNGRFFEPITDCTGFVQQGIASWYGDDFHGKKTSNGEIFDMHTISAAHKTLPLGIYARITNLNNGKKLILRINDRGPYVKGRVLDLSRAAARELGYLETGTTPVLIEALGYPAAREPGGGAFRKNPLSSGVTTRTPFDPSKILIGSCPESGEFSAHQVEARYYVQVGAFENRSSAGLLLSRVRGRFPSAVMEKALSGEKVVFCVRVKNFASRQEAEKTRLKLATCGFSDCLVVLEGFVKRS
jgi:rare lipoprotein A